MHGGGHHHPRFGIDLLGRVVSWGGDWKSSTLPLLSQDIAQLYMQKEEIVNQRLLRATAEKTKVTFVLDQGRWRLLADEGDD